MEETSGFIKLDKEMGFRSVAPTYRLYVIIDTEKVPNVKEVIGPLESILNKNKKKINKHFEEMYSSAAEIIIEPETAENGPIKGFAYDVPTKTLWGKDEKSEEVGVDELVRKKDELVSKYGLRDIPFLVFDVFSDRNPFAQNYLETYVNLLSAKKKAEPYLPSHIKFEGTLKQIIESVDYLESNPKVTEKIDNDVKRLQIQRRKDFIFSKAKEDGIITDDYKLTKRGNVYLEEVIPEIDVRASTDSIFIDRLKLEFDITDFLCQYAFCNSLDSQSDGKIRKIAQAKNIFPDELYLGVAAYVMAYGINEGFLEKQDNQIRTLDQDVKSRVAELAERLKC